MIVADAGPLIALAKLDQLTLLPKLFGTILVPDVVVQECLIGSARTDARLLRRAIDQGMFGVQSSADVPVVKLPFSLDAGEETAIRLAYHLSVPLLIDDKRGRQAAQRMHLSVVGVCGVLLYAKRKGLLGSVSPMLVRLCDQGYRLSPELIRQTLALCNEAP